MKALHLITHTPLWVWPLLAALLALGLLQTRPRRVWPGQALVFPSVMSVLTPVALTAHPGAHARLAGVLFVWGVSTLVTALAFRRHALHPSEHFSAATRRLHLAGSWGPLCVILAVFSLRYALAATQAVNPALAAQPAFTWTLAALAGLPSGWMVARIRGLWALMCGPAGFRG